MTMLEGLLPEAFIKTSNLMATSSYLIPASHSNTGASGEETV